MRSAHRRLDAISEARVRRPTERIERGTPELDPFAPGALPNLPVYDRMKVSQMMRKA